MPTATTYSKPYCMRNFKEFGIKPAQKGFVGDKIKIDRILNRSITVEAFKIEKSKFDGDRLDLQIRIGETQHVIFTGSATLREMIERVPKEAFPFQTTIVKENERYEFT